MILSGGGKLIRLADGRLHWEDSTGTVWTQRPPSDLERRMYAEIEQLGIQLAKYAVVDSVQHGLSSRRCRLCGWTWYISDRVTHRSNCILAAAEAAGGET